MPVVRLPTALTGWKSHKSIPQKLGGDSLNTDSIWLCIATIIHPLVLLRPLLFAFFVGRDAFFWVCLRFRSFIIRMLNHVTTVSCNYGRVLVPRWFHASSFSVSSCVCFDHPQLEVSLMIARLWWIQLELFVVSVRGLTVSIGHSQRESLFFSYKLREQTPFWPVYHWKKSEYRWKRVHCPGVPDRCVAAVAIPAWHRPDNSFAAAWWRLTARMS